MLGSSTLLALTAASALALTLQDGDRPAPEGSPLVVDRGGLSTDDKAPRESDADVMREQARIEREDGSSDTSPDRQRVRGVLPPRAEGPQRPPEPQLGGGDPGWEIRQADRDDTDNPQLGGGDPGWEVQSAPQVDAAESPHVRDSQAVRPSRPPQIRRPAATTPNPD